MRGQATESGAEGDTVTVLNLQSKRTVRGTVTGANQVTVAGAIALPNAARAANLNSTSTPQRAE
jgi:flagella basal body P-ring formation protein FlgA